MLHFEDKDSHIPLQGASLKAGHPRQIEHVSDADHGFNCDQRGSWHQPSAILARAYPGFLSRILGQRRPAIRAYSSRSSARSMKLADLV